MKQIFDWLREQMRNKAYKAWDGDNKREIMLITLPVVENIINEAEAKWEAEHGCSGCIREHKEDSIICDVCARAHADEYEPIKISEVE